MLYYFNAKCFLVVGGDLTMAGSYELLLCVATSWKLAVARNITQAIQIVSSKDAQAY